MYKLSVRKTTEKTLIRLLLQKQSDLGMLCLSRPLHFYGYLRDCKWIFVFTQVVFLIMYILVFTNFWSFWISRLMQKVGATKGIRHHTE